ncbi:MAG: glycosyltransferase [Bacteroidetes bacterium]|nr:glycosyltransferase [Bacteroidota bacterium]
MKEILTSYHHSFAGGSKNTSRLLNYLSDQGYTINAYFFETPQFFQNHQDSKINSHILNSHKIQSEVIQSSTINNYALSNQIVQRFEQNRNSFLFAANLFPYADLMVDAKSQLLNNHSQNPPLLIHPVGSDCWQIGPQIKEKVRWLIDNPLVNAVCTYSDLFVHDIKEYYKIKREIFILPPVLERERFYPLTNEEKLQRRKELGFNESDFIVNHHSSMRRIKCPDVVLDIVQKAASLMKKKCILIMSGPVPVDVLTSLNISTIEYKNQDSIFKFESNAENLKIFWTGILSDVEFPLQIADVEINASLYDSFNLALMEAMACGVPVVSSSVVGIAKHIELAKGGHCFETDKLNFDDLNKAIQLDSSKENLFDIDFAVSAILEIANKPYASKEMGLNGAKYMSETFSYENAAKAFHKHIN